MSLLVLLCILINLSLSLNKDPLCLSGAVSTSYDGTYRYYTTKLNPTGLVWYNSQNGYFLFPWDYGTVVEWRIGSTYLNSTAHIACNPASQTSNGYYAILDVGCDTWYELEPQSGWVRNYAISVTDGPCIISWKTTTTTTTESPTAEYYPYNTPSPTTKPIHSYPNNTPSPTREPTPSPTYSSSSALITSSGSSHIIGAVIAIILVLICIGLIIWGCKRRGNKLKYGDQYKVGLLKSNNQYPAPSQQQTQTQPQAQVITQELKPPTPMQQYVTITSPSPNHVPRQIINSPPKIVYVQAQQTAQPQPQPQMTPAYIHIPMTEQRKLSKTQPGTDDGMNGNNEQELGPSTDMYPAIEEDDAPPPYINPSAPSLSVVDAERINSGNNVMGNGVYKVSDVNEPVYMNQISIMPNADLESFLRGNGLGGYENGLKEAGAESINDLKELDDEEIKQVAIEAGMNDEDQQKFINACNQLK